MARKQRKQNQRLLIVSIGYVAVPDAIERLSRGIDILLKAAAEDTPQSKGKPNEKEEPSAQAPTEDAPIRGSGGNDSHDEG